MDNQEESAPVTPLPSHFLPPLIPLPPFIQLLTPLALLQAQLAPSEILVDLTSGVIDQARKEESEIYEIEFARGWLKRLISGGLREIARGQDEDGEWEKLVEGAAGLLSAISGHGAAGALLRTFILPVPLPPLQKFLQLPTPPPTRPSSRTTFAKAPMDDIPMPTLGGKLEIKIRDTTLLSSDTGFRTWGAAPLLSRLISLDPLSFFPESGSSRVLELGSGTGLVGLTVAAVLERMGRKASLALTDYTEIILSNLDYNLKLNPGLLAVGSEVTINISKLDWSDYLPSPLSPPAITAQRYDTIFASDVIFEPSHISLIHATISSLLSFPCATKNPYPTVHLILPLRSTHTFETSSFLHRFSAVLPEEDAEWSSTRGEGKEWRLVLKQREEIRGGDGFSRAKGGEQEGRYWVCQIGWIEVGIL